MIKKMGNNFSLWNQRRPSCLRELDKCMYNGDLVYFNGPSSYYPDEVIHKSPPPYPSKVSKHSVREKTRRRRPPIPYFLRGIFPTSGSEVRTESIATRGVNDVLEETNDRYVHVVLENVPTDVL